MAKHLNHRHLAAIFWIVCTILRTINSTNNSESFSVNSSVSNFADNLNLQLTTESLGTENPLFRSTFRPSAGVYDETLDQIRDKNFSAFTHGGRQHFRFWGDANDDKRNDVLFKLYPHKGHRLRRDEITKVSAINNDANVIRTDWGTYEEQMPIVLHSEGGTINVSDDVSNSSIDDKYPLHLGDDADEYDENINSNESYEQRNFDDNDSQPIDSDSEESYENNNSLVAHQDVDRDPNAEPSYPSDDQEEEASKSNQIITFIQRMKTFYDIYTAMNDAWKTVDTRFNRPTDEDVQSVNNKKTRPYSRYSSPENSLGTTKESAHMKAKNTNAVFKTDQQNMHHNLDGSVDDPRARRSSLHEGSNSKNYINRRRLTTNFTKLPEAEGSTTIKSDQSQSSELDLSEASDLVEQQTTEPLSAVAEGRYIKGDPLKGYYDFVITEGSYKFWAVFQVGTALLIIYSTFAAIYYSKVNPLVSDYDYVDYLGGGRSLSDDSDFVDTDTPKATNEPSARYHGASYWTSWMPHAGHTLQFILESIDKVYNEE